MKLIPLRARDGSVRASALVDDEDFERFGGLPWTTHSAGYAYRWLGSPRRCVLLHRAVMGLEVGDPQEVDHLNRDKLDCRRANLRIVTRQANAQNVPGRGGSSRFRGVSRHRERWVAAVQVANRKVYVGIFHDEVEAARAAEARRRELMPFALPDPALAALGRT